MPRRARYSPYLRRYPPMDARAAGRRRHRAGRIVFACCALAVVVLLLGSVDWAGLGRRAEDAVLDGVREGAREAIQERMENEAPTGDGAPAQARPGPFSASPERGGR